MSDLISFLSSQIGPSFTKQVSGSLGSDPSKTEAAIGVALPMILGAMAKNSKNEKEAQAIQKAVFQKHDGGIFDNLEALVEHPSKGEGAGILKHILGENKSTVADLVAQKAGLSGTESNSVLEILAPMVMGALGKQSQENSNILEASNMSGLLSKASDSLGDNSIGSGLVVKFLDQNGDGDIKDELLGLGTKFFKNIFG